MRNHYYGPERRQHVQLSPEEFEALAQRAAQIAAPIAADIGEKNIYAAVGKGTLKRILWLLGTAAVAALSYFGYKGGIGQ